MRGDLIIKFCIVLAFLILGKHGVFAQSSQYHWKNIHHFYENLEENDEAALPFVKKKIKDLKKIKHYKELFYTYEEAVYFSKNINNKIAYADTAIIYALKTKDNIIIGKAYTGRGVIYNFYQRNYNKALTEYQTAMQYLDNTTADYQKNKLAYHIGVCKATLGYHDEAQKILTDCTDYFINQRNNASTSADYYNFTRGYLNSLHQLLISYNDHHNTTKVDSILTLPVLSEIAKSKDFNQENAYFLKEKAIALFHKKYYTEALKLFAISDETITQKKDLASQIRLIYYTTKTYAQLGNYTKARAHAVTMDSISAEFSYYPLEVHDTYRYLINSAAQNQNTQEVNFWSNKLIKADSALATNNPHIAQKLFSLINPPSQSKKDNKQTKFYLIWTAVVGIIIISSYYLIKTKTKLFHSPSSVPVPNNLTKENTGRKSEYSKEIVDQILEQLQLFEEQKGFTTKNLTITKLAASIKTNSTHLSYVLNAFKHQNFNTYLKELRINYITQLLEEDPKYLNYTIDALADCAGIASRQVFSDHFYEIKGMRPIDYIKQRKAQTKQ